jgi:hypothetical protein
MSAAPEKEHSMDDRVNPDVVCPPAYGLRHDELFSAANGMPDLALLKAHLLKEGRLEKKAALELVKRAQALHKEQPNVLELPYPITGEFVVQQTRTPPLSTRGVSGSRHGPPRALNCACT